MTTSRRGFLAQTGACVLGAAGLEFGRLAAAGAAAPREVPGTLVAVYLRGGADALGAIVPFADRDYPKLRPTLAVPGPDAKADTAALPLDGRFGFNPALKELHGLYRAGRCAPVMCVGSPDPTRSHFDAQDFMERAAPGQKRVATGWLNRYLHATRTDRDPSLRAVALQPLLPRSLRGTYPVLARPDQRADQLLKRYGALYADGPGGPAADDATARSIRAYGARTISQVRELNEMLAAAPTPAAAYPDTPFGRQMRDVARMVKARRGLEVAAIDYGGWDHHVDEGATAGQLARRLGDLSAAVGAFATDLGPAMDRVLVLVMSEFGRTVRENGTKGTDHGHGGFMLAVGGRVAGGKVYGRWTGLGEGDLYQKRDLPVHTDFRVVFAEALQGLFGFDGIKEKLFPAYTAESPPLGLMSST